MVGIVGFGEFAPYGATDHSKVDQGETGLKPETKPRPILGRCAGESLEAQRHPVGSIKCEADAPFHAREVCQRRVRQGIDASGDEIGRQSPNQRIERFCDGWACM